MDDHVLVRSGLAALISMMPGMQVVAEAGDGATLLTLLEDVDADVVVCDITMPGMSGVETIQRVHQKWPEVRTLALSIDDSPSVAHRALVGGASGYVVKHAAPSELEAAIRSVIEGRPYLSSVVAYSLLKAASEAPQEQLTVREIEVLTLITHGFDARSIGERLGISHRTVGVHRSKVMKKLDIRDVAGLTRYAIRHGLIND